MFGLPDAVYGEKVVAVITGRGGVRVEEVREWMAHHIAAYKVGWGVGGMQPGGRMSSPPSHNKNLSCIPLALFVQRCVTSAL